MRKDNAPVTNSVEAEKRVSYDEGYYAGMSHAIYAIKELEEAEPKYWMFGDKKIPVVPEMEDAMKVCCYNMRQHLERVRDELPHATRSTTLSADETGDKSPTKEI